jgi:hypothetical protein
LPNFLTLTIFYWGISGSVCFGSKLSADFLLLYNIFPFPSTVAATVIVMPDNVGKKLPNFGKKSPKLLK